MSILKKNRPAMTAKQLKEVHKMCRISDTPANKMLYRISIDKKVGITDAEAKKMVNSVAKRRNDEVIVLHAKKFKKMIRKSGFIFLVVPKNDPTYTDVFVCREADKNEMKNIIKAIEVSE